MTTKEIRNARSRDWYRRNREHCLARSKAWHAANPDPERTARHTQTRIWQKAARLLLVKQDMGGMCVDCGNDDPLVLDFDHRLPKQKTIIVTKCSTLASMRHEASKCDLRCANCHRRKTWYRREAGRKVRLGDL